MDPTAANRTAWNAWTAHHVQAAFYDVPGFLAGANTLPALDIAELGDVRGRTLLHLQCHFGLDTLSWARLGARVTGLDFSEVAIANARELAAQAGIDARFVHAAVQDAPAAVGAQFDIVYTSYGVLSWLPDLDAWARAAAACTRPGGRLHLIEFHPLLDALADDGITLEYPYMSPEPVRTDSTASYAAPDVGCTITYNWSHGLGDVISCLLAAGYHIDSVREHATAAHGVRPFLAEREPGTWVHATRPGTPLRYSIAATLQR